MPELTHQQVFELAMDHHRAGRLGDAEALYRQLLALYPGSPDLVHSLGVLAHQAGHLQAGLDLIQQSIAASPGSSFYYSNLGLLLTDLGQLENAVAAFQTAIRLQADGAEAYYNLGITLLKQGRAEEAITAFRTAIQLKPDHLSAPLNLGNALNEAGRADEAIAYYRSVLERMPENAAIANNLGNLLKDQAQLTAAIESYRAALALTPEDAVTLSNLGVALKDSGEIGAALDCFRRGVTLDPHRPELHSNFIFTSYFDPGATQEGLAAELRCWDLRHAEPLRAGWSSHSNDRSPNRRLRIGYVSADFRDHVVGRTLLPCFEVHDSAGFELVCYSGSPVVDEVAQRFHRRADEWRDMTQLNDEQLAAQIRADRIDILVDLALHTSHNRLLAFARRPAPVQISWLGYPGTSGLRAIDYRITDPWLDPPGHDLAGPFEEPVRLPECWCCYAAPDPSPDPGELPAARQGRVTFGSFNNLAKTNARVLAVWADILQRVPGSRLILLSKASREDHVRAFFQERGIADDRIEFLGYYPGATGGPRETQPAPYLARYQQIDIALDPFPYNGMTTTCDALWMGVPVVALIGKMTLGRASLSLLSNLGLPEFAAASEAAYAEVACTLASDLPRLTDLRGTLRGRMQKSPLLDAARLARHLEAAFHRMWQRWCAAPGQNPLQPEMRAPTVRVP